MNEDRIAEITKALHGIPYNRQNDRQDSLMRQLVSLYKRRGRDENGQKLEAAARSLDEDITRLFGNQLTWMEAVLALDWGARGEYGDVRNLSVDTLLNFVRSYMASEVRGNALRMHKASRRVSPDEQSERDKVGRLNWQACYDHALSLWEEWTRPLAEGESLSERPLSALVPGYMLRIAGLHALHGTWNWLIEIGTVSPDFAVGEDREMAEAKADEIKGLTDKQRVMAVEGKLFERLLWECVKNGYDFAAIVRRDAEAVPEKDRRFWIY